LSHAASGRLGDSISEVDSSYKRATVPEDKGIAARRMAAASRRREGGSILPTFGAESEGSDQEAGSSVTRLVVGNAMADVQGKAENQVTREKTVKAAKEAERMAGAAFLSRDEFTQATGITQCYICRLLPEGGWGDVVWLASLQPFLLRSPDSHDPAIFRQISRLKRRSSRYVSFSCCH
jgi:hypothetical protein